MTKIIKLFANLSTEETVAFSEFTRLKGPISQLVIALAEAVENCNIEDNEEFILNAVSSITNILYYDTQESPLLELSLIHI